MKKSAVVFCAVLLGFSPQVVFADKNPQTKEAPVPPEKLVHLGNISGRQGKYKEAIAYYTKAISENPDFANAYYNRGWIYMKMRKLKLSINDLGRAIDLNPHYISAYHLRGIAYFWTKKYALAVQDYSNAIELDPKNLKFYFSRLSAYCKLGNGGKAWEDVIQIQKLGGTVNPTVINLLKAKNYRE